MKIFLPLLLLFTLLTVALPSVSHAAPPPAGDTLAETCTTQPIFDITKLKDFLQEIVDTVDFTLRGIAEDMFNGIVQNTKFLDVVMACLILYIMVYGVCFMFGIIPANFYVAFMRLFKICVIFLVISPDGWAYLFDTAAGTGFISGIFQDGVCYLINVMLAIGTGDDPSLVTCDAGAPDNPFGILNGIIMLLLSPRMFIIILGASGTGPFGILLAAMIVGAMTYVLRMILEALRIYVLYLIIKTLLFGLAPIFFIFILFDRTKHIFDGWLKALVSISLQTVMMFAYLAFYASLVESAASDMVPTQKVELCYTKETQTGVEDVHTWRFMVEDDNGKLQPYEGQWKWCGMVSPKDKDCAIKTNGKIFPVNPVKILIFLLISYIGFQMMTIVLSICSELVNNLSLAGMGGNINSKLSGMIKGGGKGK